MCGVTVIVVAALALAALIALARWQARRKDERAAREDSIVDGEPVADVDPEPDTGDHDPGRGLRRFVTVAELVEREAGAQRERTRPGLAAVETTIPLPAAARLWPTPYPRGGQR